MLQTAKRAAIPAYAPYGRQGQGAAVLTATGKIYTGCTMENAELSLSLSALRSAVSRAVGEGEFELRAAVVVTPEGDVVPPAPEDLQTLFEFGRGVLAVLEPVKGTYTTSMMAELLSTPVEPITPVIKIE